MVLFAFHYNLKSNYKIENNCINKFCHVFYGKALPLAILVLIIVILDKI